MPLFLLPQVRVVLLAEAPVDRLFVHTGGDDERDRQLLDDLGLSGVKLKSAATVQDKLKQQEKHHYSPAVNGHHVSPNS